MKKNVKKKPKRLPTLIEAIQDAERAEVKADGTVVVSVKPKRKKRYVKERDRITDRPVE